MPSAWVRKRGKRFRVEYRLGGREASVRYAGTFDRKGDALDRRAWVVGEGSDARPGRPPRRLRIRRNACDSGGTVAGIKDQRQRRNQGDPRRERRSDRAGARQQSAGGDHESGRRRPGRETPRGRSSA